MKLWTFSLPDKKIDKNKIYILCVNPTATIPEQVLTYFLYIYIYNRLLATVLLPAEGIIETSALYYRDEDETVL
jgi:hypothetical protein